MTYKNKLIVNDGFNPELAEGARFDGEFEFPVIEPMEEIIVPKYLVPFSERDKASNPRKTFVVFYEYDDKFADIIRNPDRYINDLARFGGIISPDNSLYRDMPFSCQICNIYRNRLIGSYFQRCGIPVIGNCRWGDERTYLSTRFGEPIAFVSLPKHNIVSIGTYGCIKGNNNKKHFKKGVRAMLEYLKPETVIVYGAMPDDIFGEIKNKTRFVGFSDWTSARHEGGRIWEAE